MCVCVCTRVRVCVRESVCVCLCMRAHACACIHVYIGSSDTKLFSLALLSSGTALLLSTDHLCTVFSVSLQHLCRQERVGQCHISLSVVVRGFFCLFFVFSHNVAVYDRLRIVRLIELLVIGLCLSSCCWLGLDTCCWPSCI